MMPINCGFPRLTRSPANPQMTSVAITYVSTKGYGFLEELNFPVFLLRSLSNRKNTKFEISGGKRRETEVR